MEAYWAQEAAARQVVPHLRVGSNVWDLLEMPDILRDLLARTPGGALLLIGGGPPCQDLTRAGPGAGALGLTGSRSSNFYVFPALCRVIQKARPDIHLHVMVENAGSMRPEHRQAIQDSLGLAGGSGPVINAGLWTSFTRSRTFFSPLPREPGLPPRMLPRSGTHVARLAPHTRVQHAVCGCAVLARSSLGGSCVRESARTGVWWWWCVCAHARARGCARRICAVPRHMPSCDCVPHHSCVAAAYSLRL